MKYLIVPIVCFLIWYVGIVLVVDFITWGKASFDPADWDRGTRFLFISISIAVVLFGLLLANEWH